jgi:hypothetical protein
MKVLRPVSAPARGLALGLSLAGVAASVSACDAGRKEGENVSSGARLSIASPKMDETLQGDVVEVMLDLRDYPIGTEPGPHVHVIVDNEPYRAIYDATKPVRLEGLKQGTHVVRAFPSAGPWKKEGDAEHHESRKNEGAFAWVRFHVKGALAATEDPLRTFDATKPTLTYSRPKGEYAAGTRERERLLLDFYVTGTTLSADGHRVRVQVDGADAKVTDLDGNPVTTPLAQWKPYLLSPTPPAGERTVLLELVDRDGKPVPGPFNRTERKITIK